jgi:hypothetical protein
MQIKVEEEDKRCEDMVFMSTAIEVMSEEYRYLLLKKLKGRRICYSKVCHFDVRMILS